MQIDLKEKQARRDERFKGSLFGELPPQGIIQQGQTVQLSNESFVQIFIKCLITPDIVVEKQLVRQNYLENSEDDIEILLDDVIGLQLLLLIILFKKENQDLGMKKEFNVFVERELVNQIPLLQKNYIEKQDLIKMPVCGANGIRLPEENDFALYFKFFKLKTDPLKQQILIQDQDLKSQFGLLICGSIFNDETACDTAFKEITKKPTIEILFKLLLITAQYESEKYSLFVYRLVRCLFLFQANLLQEITDPILQIALSNKTGVTYEVLKPNFIKLKLKEHIITINTTFLYPIYKKYESDKNDFLKPLDSYQYFNVLRNADIQDEQESNTFPHIYYIKHEQNQTVHLIGLQAESHSEIQLYRYSAEKYSKYNENYVGSIKRNLMGTSFKVLDDGYSKKHSIFFPEWIGAERRHLMNIEYETNIMASCPRKFDISFYNFETKKLEELVNLAPTYNAERDCYQLHFYGRAKIPSARNFQMVRPDDKSTVYLLHGKVN